MSYFFFFSFAFKGYFKMKISPKPRGCAHGLWLRSTKTIEVKHEI